MGGRYDMDNAENQFWSQTLASWKALPIKERNFRKSIGCEPNEEVSRRVFKTLRIIPASQLQLDLTNNQND
jgi:hypothetical protein